MSMPWSWYLIFGSPLLPSIITTFDFPLLFLQFNLVLCWGFWSIYFLSICMALALAQLSLVKTSTYIWLVFSLGTDILISETFLLSLYVFSRYPLELHLTSRIGVHYCPVEGSVFCLGIFKRISFFSVNTGFGFQVSHSSLHQNPTYE